MMERREYEMLLQRILALERRLAGGLVVAGGGGGGGSAITALTGDVTASGPGSSAATIASDAVTNAKLANMAQDTIKGRADAAGTGDPQDLTANQVSTILDTATDPFRRSSSSVPGGSGGGLILIEKKTITSASTSVTFSGLNGDTDEVYFMMGRIIVPATGSNPWITWQPNGITSNQTSYRAFSTDIGGYAKDSRSDLHIVNIAVGTTVNFRMDIYAKKNPHSVSVEREYQGSFWAWYGSDNALGTFGGRWNESSTNITSIVINSDVASKLGDGTTLALYKYAQT